MHEKVEHLFAQKTQRQEDIRQNKLPRPLLSLLGQILFNVRSITLIVTFKFLFIFFDHNFNYFL